VAEEGNQGGVGSDCFRTAAPDAVAVFVQLRQMPLLCSFSRARCRCCVRSAAPGAVAVFVQPRHSQSRAFSAYRLLRKLSLLIVWRSLSHCI
jgi:hypothetical protein